MFQGKEQRGNEMFVAIDAKGTVVVTAQSKGQAFRMLVQQGLQPENYMIKETK